jgi:hypothetical protein
LSLNSGDSDARQLLQAKYNGNQNCGCLNLN